MRNVVAHYHVFKNAGVSVDATLRAILPNGYFQVEATPSKPLAPGCFAAFIESHPEGVLFSSHTALFPVPEIEDVQIFPIIFVRHPIDRLRSVYEFERRTPLIRGQVGELGVAVAKELPFPEYVKWRFERLDGTLDNHHVRRFSAGIGPEVTLEAAKAYTERLPFVGVVEHFDASMHKLKRCLSDLFPLCEAPVRHYNQTPGRLSSLEARIALIRAELGDALYEKVLEHNQDDLALYEVVCCRNGFDANSNGAA